MKASRPVNPLEDQGRCVTPRRRLGTLIVLTVIVACSGTARPACAQTGQFFDEFGASPKSIAMGQAFTAVADDFSAAYYNPAGLSQIHSIAAVTIGYFYAKPEARATFSWGPDRYDNDLPLSISEQKSSHGAIIGVASDLDIPSLVRAYPWFRRLGFGLVFWLNLPEMLQYHTGPEAYRPHCVRYDRGFSINSMVFALSFEATSWLSLGAGAFLSQKVYTQEHNMSAINRSNFFPIPIPGWVPDEVIGTRLSVVSQAEAFVVPLAGLLLRPPIRRLEDKLSFGVSWRRGQKVHHGRGRMKVGLGYENPDGSFAWYTFLAELDKTAIVGFQPTQVTFALAVRPLEGLLISADVTWKDWSKYVTYLDQPPDPPFQDTWVPRVGAEYGLRPQSTSPWFSWMERIAIRAGYFFEPTPVPHLESRENNLDTDMDVISAGLEIGFSSWDGWLRHTLEAYYQIHLLRERRFYKTEDTWFGPGVLDGRVWSFGVSLTTSF